MPEIDVNTYTDEQITEAAQRAVIEQHDYIELMLDKYENACKDRGDKGIVPIALCGHGRSGKDFGCQFLSEITGIRFSGSISYVVAPLVATALGQDLEETFSVRHQQRMFWYKFFNAVRLTDPSLLVKMTLADNDIVSGIRDKMELQACKQQRDIEYSVWIENPAAALDPTLIYRADDCDIMLFNSGDPASYFRKLRCLARLLNFPSR